MPLYRIEEHWPVTHHVTAEIEADTPEAAMQELKRRIHRTAWASSNESIPDSAGNSTYVVWDETMSRELLSEGPEDGAADLRSALRDVLQFFPLPGEGSNDRFERIAEAFRQETGIMAPGKDVPAALNDSMSIEERRARYDAWVAGKVAAGRALVAGDAAAPSPLAEALDALDAVHKALDGRVHSNPALASLRQAYAVLGKHGRAG